MWTLSEATDSSVHAASTKLALRYSKNNKGQLQDAAFDVCRVASDIILVEIIWPGSVVTFSLLHER